MDPVAIHPTRMSVMYYFYGKILDAVILTYILFHCFYMLFCFISVFYCYVLSVTDMEFEWPIHIYGTMNPHYDHLCYITAYVPRSKCHMKQGYLH